VFVGGQVAELLITDSQAVRIRPTVDVDVVVSAVSRVEYHRMGQRLREFGFVNDTREAAPICRWLSSDGHVLDLMPVDEAILGFSNRWYSAAVQTATPFRLKETLVIRIPTAPLFLASKLEAFRGRGGGDLLGSHDLEDVITIVAGRPELVDEVDLTPDEVRRGIGDHVRSLPGDPDFFYAIDGALPDAALSPSLIPMVRSKFVELATGP
jgi:hypothetical protein